jgi:hypothetical protein
MNPTVNDFYFYLQGAVPSQPTYNKYGGENISQIDLHKEADGTYRGGDTIIFDYEGDKCFTAAPQPPPTVKGLCHEGQEPIIHISSADSLFQLQTQHVTIALTWAFGAFTVILIREFVMGFGSNTMALLHRRQKEHMDADNALTLAFGTLTAILIQECVMTLWRRRHKERMDADNNPNAQKDNSKNGKNHRN